MCHLVQIEAAFFKELVKGFFWLFHHSGHFSKCGKVLWHRKQCNLPTITFRKTSLTNVSFPITFNERYTDKCKHSNIK